MWWTSSALSRLWLMLIGRRGKARQSDLVFLGRWPMAERFSIEPLAAVVAGRTGSASSTAMIAQAVGVSGRTVQRWKRAGLSCWVADRAATELALHPSEVWDGWWECDDHPIGQDVAVG